MYVKCNGKSDIQDTKDTSPEFLKFKTKILEVLDVVRTIPDEHKSAAREYITENYFEILKILDESPRPVPDRRSVVENSTPDVSMVPTSSQSLTAVPIKSTKVPSPRQQPRRRGRRRKGVTKKTSNSVVVLERIPNILDKGSENQKQTSDNLADYVKDQEYDTDNAIIRPVNNKMFESSILHTNQHWCQTSVEKDTESGEVLDAVIDESLNNEQDQDVLMDEIDNIKPKSNIPYVKEGTPETDDVSDVTDVSSLLSFLPQLSPYIKFDMKDGNVGDKDGFLHLAVERSDGSVQNLKIGGITSASPEELKQHDSQHLISENRADKQINLIQEQLKKIEKENNPFLEETKTDLLLEPMKRSRGRPRKEPIFPPVVDDEGKEMFTCSVCRTSLKTQHAMKVHMRKHTGIKPFTCRFCDKSFTTKGNMKQHEGTHNDEKPWQCQHCDKSFKDKKVLNVHQRRHTGERPYKCHLCDKAFSQNGVLKEHLLIHTGQKPHLCDLCGQEFRGLSSLRAHRLRHLNKRDFKCDKCNKEFICKNDLSRHYMTHTGNRPFVCSLCPKRFTRLNYLKEHMNVHDGSKPFACPECNVSFADSMSLHRHKKKHKSEKDDHSKLNYQSELEKELTSGNQTVGDDNLPTIEITEQTAFGQQTSVQVVLDENTTVEEFQRFHSLVLSAANSVDFTLNSHDPAKQVFQVMCVNPDTQEIVDHGQGQNVICEGHRSDFSAMNMLANATAQQ